MTPRNPSAVRTREVIAADLARERTRWERGGGDRWEAADAMKRLEAELASLPPTPSPTVPADPCATDVREADANERRLQIADGLRRPDPDREHIGKAIWEAQRARLVNQDGINARMKWRDIAAPSRFWDSFVLDADAAIAAGVGFPTLAQPASDAAWRDIASAPKDGDDLDLFGGGRRWTDCHWHCGKWLYWSATADCEPHHARVANPTHWMRVERPSGVAPSSQPVGEADVLHGVWTSHPLSYVGVNPQPAATQPRPDAQPTGHGIISTSDWGVHDLRPHGSGQGRWCVRCGLVETTCSIEGFRCVPLYAGPQPAQPADAAQSGGERAYQARVDDWLFACFGAEIARDRIERNHRFIEEALETVQANGCTRSEAHQLVDYVYDRPVGDLHQEVGGVLNTLAALCLASGIDMAEAGEVELARVWTKVEKIRAKQAAKPKHSPLPEHAPPSPGVPQ